MSVPPDQMEPVVLDRITDFTKFMHLAHQSGGDFQCTTRAGKILEWNDPRPQPTYEEIDAVDLTVAEKAEDDRRATRLVEQHPDPVVQAILDNDPALKAAVLAQLKTSQAARR